MDEGSKSIDSARNVGISMRSLDCARDDQGEGVARDDSGGETRDDMGRGVLTTTKHLPKKALRRGAWKRSMDV